jgi:hypothetical protein
LSIINLRPSTAGGALAIRGPDTQLDESALPARPEVFFVITQSLACVPGYLLIASFTRVASPIDVHLSLLFILLLSPFFIYFCSTCLCSALCAHDIDDGDNFPRSSGLIRLSRTAEEREGKKKRNGLRLSIVAWYYIAWGDGREQKGGKKFSGEVSFLLPAGSSVSCPRVVA